MSGLQQEKDKMQVSISHLYRVCEDEPTDNMIKPRIMPLAFAPMNGPWRLLQPQRHKNDLSGNLDPEDGGLRLSPDSGAHLMPQRKDLIETSAQQPSGVHCSTSQSSPSLNSLLYMGNALWPFDLFSNLADFGLENVPGGVPKIQEVIAVSHRDITNSGADFGLGNRISLY
ncbi:hypothetical protein CLAIMM_09363 [Cladophialophora immunda]|nr:hypothetical protein CLAIMM_09363 [Cladophialophora immunda]